MSILSEIQKAINASQVYLGKIVLEVMTIISEEKFDITNMGYFNNKDYETYKISYTRPTDKYYRNAISKILKGIKKDGYIIDECEYIDDIDIYYVYIMPEF